MSVNFQSKTKQKVCPDVADNNQALLHWEM